MRARCGDRGHCRSIATIGERTPSDGRCHRQRGARASGHDSGSTVDAVSALLPSFSPNERKAERPGDSDRSRAALGDQRNSAVDVCARQVTRWPHDRSFLHRPVEVTYGSNTLQGIGDTGGVVNQVRWGAPRRWHRGTDSRESDLGRRIGCDGMGAKIGALVDYRSSDFDASFGAALGSNDYSVRKLISRNACC